MPHRATSSLCLNSQSGSTLLYNYLPQPHHHHHHHPRPRHHVHRRVLSGSSTLVDLYQPIGVDLDDTTPPPPYELLDPISSILPQDQTILSNPQPLHQQPQSQPQHQPQPQSPDQTTPIDNLSSSISSSSSTFSSSSSQPRSTSRPRGPRPLPNRLHSDSTASGHHLHSSSSSSFFDFEPKSLLLRRNSRSEFVDHSRTPLELQTSNLNHPAHPVPPATEPNPEKESCIDPLQSEQHAKHVSALPQSNITAPPPSTHKPVGSTSATLITEANVTPRSPARVQILIPSSNAHREAPSKAKDENRVNKNCALRRSLPVPSKPAHHHDTSVRSRVETGPSHQLPRPKPPLTNASRIKNKRSTMMTRSELPSSYPPPGHHPHQAVNTPPQSSSSTPDEIDEGRINHEPESQPAVVPSPALPSTSTMSTTAATTTTSPTETTVAATTKQLKRREKLIKTFKSHQNVAAEAGLNQQIQSKSAHRNLSGKQAGSNREEREPSGGKANKAQAQAHPSSSNENRSRSCSRTVSPPPHHRQPSAFTFPFHFIRAKHISTHPSLNPLRSESVEGTTKPHSFPLPSKNTNLKSFHLT